VLAQPSTLRSRAKQAASCRIGTTPSTKSSNCRERTRHHVEAIGGARANQLPVRRRSAGIADQQQMAARRRHPMVELAQLSLSRRAISSRSAARLLRCSSRAAEAPEHPADRPTVRAQRSDSTVNACVVSISRSARRRSPAPPARCARSLERRRHDQHVVRSPAAFATCAFNPV